jgi:hypothetical protein
MSISMKEKLLEYINSLLFGFQKLLLLLSSLLFSVYVRRTKELWVIGTDETANYIHFLSKIFNDTYSVSLSSNKFYKENSYTFSLDRFSCYASKYTRLLVGPILLGYLINKSSSFVYIGNTGFLISSIDGRDFEFRFIKSKDGKLITFFCGADIRSVKLSIEHAKKLDIDVMASYYYLLFPYCMDEKYEISVKLLANSADQYSDIIFNMPVDQISYLKRKVEPFFYIYPDNKI